MTGNGRFLSIGWRYIVPVWGATLAVLIFSDAVFLNLLLIIVSFFTAYLFYVPERVPAEVSKNAVISPVDGRVESVDEKGEGISIVIRKSLFDGSSVVRAPMECDIERKIRIHGLFLQESLPLAKSLNERAEVSWHLANREYLMKIRCGFYALALPWINSSKSVEAGNGIALLSDGSVELVLPKFSKVEVAVGDKVVGGFSLLAYGKE